MSTDVNFKRIESAIRFLKENAHRQPSLEETAAQVHLSPFHFQRLFTEWAGISPKKFIQYLTLEELKKDLHASPNLPAAAQQAGLSSPSRIYDLFVKIESVTPNEYKTGGQGLEIVYGTHATPFGNCFIAVTMRGICFMSFLTDQEDDLPALTHMWPHAECLADMVKTKKTIDQIFGVTSSAQPVNLFVKGTAFQVKVWEALLKIPFGTVSSYSHIAGSIKNPAATRAVGTAIGANPVAYLIPCHRVIRTEGIIGQYHWGSGRKAAMIGWEKSKRNS